MSTIQNLISEGALVLYHDYRSGSAYDWSGNSNTGTLINIRYSREGILCNGVDSEITLTNMEVTTTATIAMIANGSEFAGGTNTSGRNSFVITTTTVTFKGDSDNVADGVSWTHSGALDVDKEHSYIGVSNATGMYLYVDGVLKASNTSSFVNVDIDTGDTYYIGSGASLAGRHWKGFIANKLIASTDLDATEALALHNELVALRWPTKTSHRFKGNNEILNGNFKNWTADDPDDWTVFGTEDAGSYITESSQRCNLVSDGDNIGIQQTTLTAGRIYEVIINVISLDTTLELNMVSGSNVLINSTGLKRYKMTAGTSAFQIKRNVTVGAVNCIFDNVSVRPWHGSWMTGYGAHESSGNTTAGYLENTPFQVQSGSFKVSVQTVNNRPTKVIQCVTAGIVSIPTSCFQQTPTEAAYGTWEWWMYKGADANTTKAFFINTNGTAVAVASGYNFQFTNDERVKIEETGVGNQFQSDTSEISNNIWYKCGVIRTAGNEFSTYINDTLVVAIGGTNPFTDASVITSNFMLFDLDAGDMIALASFDGQHAISKAVV
jgi:hypothetical protein